MEVKFELEDALVTENVQQFADRAKEMVELYTKKNHDYGNSFEKGMNVIGIKYGTGRLYDKMNRILTITDNEAKVDESIEDTLIDLANYSIMMLNYLKNKKIKETKNISFE